ncbi:NAD-dependent epimerase/dehydratase family protein [Urechidicola vernalis]|uniref:NAD-dependent epimerase/dehydratase family protein n=1 Tax=Urechidicola vernalis TaxID=3075600 RepID=A0ABU2Y5B0_9FLAO|nr:NAD-dependent epimerase/dehydratase family protein [Urechidicola sp. P050]MDT0553355.1 NAD-dependent epimerase/dehydratase family protein [Urechidicola sp. P050]
MKKSISRRALIKTGIKAGMIIPFLGHSLFATTHENADKKLKILILGGTSFLGPHQIAYAIARGHSISTFTRGKTTPTIYKDLFKQVEQLTGDRENDLSALENRKWDVVIDNSGRKTEWTKKTATLLKNNVRYYIYTSSTGVYYPYLGDNISEETELNLTVPEGVSEYEKLEYDYGVMKATSENEAIKAFGKDRAIIVRPTYMIGPADRTDRFIHWPIRLAKGGEVLVPGKIDDPVQYIDVRDVAEWMIRLAENNISGTFNAVGPEKEQTMNEFVKEAKKTFPVKSSLIKINDYKFLQDNNVHFLVPWIPSEGKNYGSSRINNEKSIANGLSFRSLHNSIKDTHDWWYSDAIDDERRNKVELNPKSVLVREKDLITKWKKREH